MVWCLVKHRDNFTFAVSLKRWHSFNWNGRSSAMINEMSNLINYKLESKGSGDIYVRHGTSVQKVLSSRPVGSNADISICFPLSLR